MISKQNLQTRIAGFWPKKDQKTVESTEEKNFYKDKIKTLLLQNNACLIAHYYVDPHIQSLLDGEINGTLGDSLSMAHFGRNNAAETIVVAGVRFMGETAKILSPDKKVIMPDLNAHCSLDISCTEKEFKSFIADHPDRTVVVYVNTSARIKALADWTVTSSNALSICRYLTQRGEKILWAPDKYLGRWIEKQTGADMVHYNGSCVVHEEFKASSISILKAQYPNAAVLVHPESPEDVVQLADCVGSTSHLLNASKKLKNPVFIVATDAGIIYQMQKHSPNKIFIKAPTMGNGASCKSCAHCPWMKMNNLKNLASVIEKQNYEIIIPDHIQKKAIVPLTRMMHYSD